MRTFPIPDPGTPAVDTPARYLSWLAGRHKVTLALAAGYGVVCTLAQALVPAAVGMGIDEGMISRDRSALVFWACAVLGLGVVQAVTGTLRDRASITNRFGATYRTMQLVTRHSARLGATLPKRVSAGEVLSVGATDINRIGAALEGTARGSGAIVSIVVVAVIMLATSWWLGVVVLVGVPLMVWGLAKLVRILHARQGAQRTQQAELTGIAVDIVSGLRVLRGIGGERVFADRYRQESQRVRETGVRAASIEATVLALRILVPGALVTIVVWLGARAVLSGELAAGELIAFYGYAVFLAAQLRRIADLVDRITRGHVAAGHVVRLLRVEPEWTGGTRDLPWPAPLVDPVTDLVVVPDRTTAVVCASPGDADRIAERLGFYTESATTLGDVPLADLPRYRVRGSILVVTNSDRLFSGVLRDELDTGGRAEDDGGILDRTLDDACARDIVDGVTGGLDAEVVGAGREFSGGQQQRLRLARALLANPDVLVLVESTNAVDAHTEQRIAERLRAARTGRATVVFTTSPALLDRADHVVLVVDGRVVAEGTHGRLLDDDRYRGVVSREAGVA